MRNVIWTTLMDEKFIKAMITEQEKGNRVDGIFIPQAYSNMVQELNKVLQQPIKKDHLKNRLKTLKDRFAQFNKKPEAEKWKTKPINHYEEMIQLFAKDKDRANGARAVTAKERRKQLEQNNSTAQTIEKIDEFLETNDITLESFNTSDEIEIPVTSTQTKLPSGSKSRKRKMQEDDQFTCIIKESIKSVVDAIDRNTKVLESSCPRVYSEEEIYKELEVMGMNLDELANAYIFLVECPEKARALFGCPVRMRMIVLGKMMGARV